jgi:hypothetical protein
MYEYAAHGYYTRSNYRKHNPLNAGSLHPNISAPVIAFVHDNSGTTS